MSVSKFYYCHHKILTLDLFYGPDNSSLYQQIHFFQLGFYITLPCLP